MSNESLPEFEQASSQEEQIDRLLDCLGEVFDALECGELDSAEELGTDVFSHTIGRRMWGTLSDEMQVKVWDAYQAYQAVLGWEEGGDHE